jgi:hypothetical protein
MAEEYPRPVQKSSPIIPDHPFPIPDEVAERVRSEFNILRPELERFHLTCYWRHCEPCFLDMMEPTKLQLSEILATLDLVLGHLNHEESDSRYYGALSTAMAALEYETKRLEAIYHWAQLTWMYDPAIINAQVEADCARLETAVSSEE